jgi:hypothetical protein
VATVTYDIDLGLANVGTFPVFALFSDAASLVALPKPGLVEYRGGIFRWTFNWDANPGTSALVWKVIQNGVEVSGVVTPDGDAPMLYGQPWYFSDFGVVNVGGSPAFSFFARTDSGADVTPPSAAAGTVVEVGQGVFAFQYPWTGLTYAAVEMKWTLGGVEVWAIISAAAASPVEAPLPGQATLGAIRLLAQQRADMVNSSFVTPAEWLTYINGSWARLYGLITETFGADYYAPERFQFQTSGTSDTYPLPDGSARYTAPDGSTAKAFFKLLGVEVQATGTPTGWVSLKPFRMAERNQAGVPGVPARRPKYRLAKSSLWLRPLPMGGLTLQVLYAPRYAALVLDTDLLDGVNGWEEFVALDAARKALAKEESDTSGVEREIADLLARIQHEADNRDEGEPAVVADVQRGGIDLADEWWPV